MTRDQFVEKYGFEIAIDGNTRHGRAYVRKGPHEVRREATIAEVILWDLVLGHEHEFTELQSAARSGGYFKVLPQGSAHDQSVAYTMLFCARCGATKEVIAKDYRQERSEGEPKE